MIAIVLAMALQAMSPAEQAQYEQDMRDAQMEQRGLQGVIEGQQGDMQIDAPPQQGQTERGEPPSKTQIKELERRIERAGGAYEVMGRCAGSMTPGEVEAVLRQAQANPAGQYLLGRYEKGFRKPKGDEWCSKAMGRL